MEEDPEVEHAIYKVKVRWEAKATWEHTFDVNSDDVRKSLGLDPDEDLTDEEVIDYLCEGDELSDASDSMISTEVWNELEVGESKVIGKKVLPGPIFTNPAQTEITFEETT